eukprot:4188939-Amphidinium_carterae.1
MQLGRSDGTLGPTLGCLLAGEASHLGRVAPASGGGATPLDAEEDVKGACNLNKKAEEFKMVST